MKCIKCGEPFSQDDILMIEEDGEEPICGLCEWRDEYFLITHNGDTFAVEAEDLEDAIRKWKRFALKVDILEKENSFTVEVEARQINYFVPKELISID